MSGKEEEGKFKKKEEVVETKDTKTPKQIKDEKVTRYRTLTDEMKALGEQIRGLNNKIEDTEKKSKDDQKNI